MNNFLINTSLLSSISEESLIILKLNLLSSITMKDKKKLNIIFAINLLIFSVINF